MSVLAGDSRTGKTYAVKRYVKDHPPRVDEGGMVFPVVYADMPIDGGFRGVLESLAEALQVNFSLRMNNPALLAAVLRSLQERRTELLLLDEFQEIFNPDNPRLLNFGRKLVRKILNLGTLNVTLKFVLARLHEAGLAGVPRRQPASSNAGYERGGRSGRRPGTAAWN